MVWKTRYADCSHSHRSGTDATVIPPVMCSAMSWPDSFSISDRRSMVYACSAAMFGSALSACTPPAACHEEPRRQDGALDQSDVGPAELGEVVEHRRADHASTDDDDLVVGLHACLLRYREPCSGAQFRPSGAIRAGCVTCGKNTMDALAQARTRRGTPVAGASDPAPRVAPGKPSLYRAEVELGSGDAHRDFVGAGAGDRVGQLERAGVHADGSLDGLRVPPDPSAPGVEHRVLVPYLLARRAFTGAVACEPVPDVGVLRRQAQRDLLAAAPDHHGAADPPAPD